MTENTKNQYRCETCCNYASTDCPSETKELLFDINHNNFLGFSMQRDKMYDITGKCMDDAIKMLQPKVEKIGMGEEKCCDNPHYIMEGGCRICTNCGKSRCS